jgi:hypothetical protein
MTISDISDTEPSGKAGTDDGVPPVSSSRSSRVAGFLLMSLIVAVLIGLVVSVAPPRLRLLGLLAIGVGVIAGWSVARLATALRIRVPVATIGVGFLAGVVATSVSSALFFREFQAAGAAQKPNPAAAMARRVLEDSQPSADESPAMAEFREHLNSIAEQHREAELRRTTFRGYLETRSRELGLTGSASSLLWGFELLLAGLSAAFVSRRLTSGRFCDDCGHWLKPLRIQTFRSPVPAVLIDATRDADVAPVSIAHVRLVRCECPNRRPTVDVVIESAESHIQARVANVALNDTDWKTLLVELDRAQGLTSSHL